MSDQHDQKFVLLAGVLAAGLLASAFAATMLQSATAQNQTDAQSQPVTTGMDDGNTATASVNDSISTLSTLGMATTKVQPDKFSVTVGVETNGTTAQQATSSNANLTADVIAALKDLGIAEDQISTSSYSVNPVYDQKAASRPCIDIYPPPPECQPGQRIVGYAASSSLSVTVDTEGDVGAGEVIDAAVKAGANNVSGVFFFVSQDKQDEVRNELIKDAIANARDRADVAAGAAGMQVSEVQSINLNDASFPALSGEAAAPTTTAAQTQILPGQQDVTMTVSVVYLIGN